MESFLRAFAVELVACVRETRADGGGKDVLLNTLFEDETRRSSDAYFVRNVIM